ncbi:hypothetical protein [Streptomyces sp. H27-D2]|uniref:hypothetical protein n=1 Tax=Streptomyces sp. H27-D2 TaxID=3046304 RepID=UPI002DBEBDA4|nr:hypothetical protein [Streptomyces sp. H27-D2]MEC4018011.1 hypothetical protein [Streptomyces sp. H27-D2]
MLALRLARGAHPLVQLRRALVVVASAGIGFLLLCTLGYATVHPHRTADSLVRLLWCLVPLAAVVQLAVAVARTDPSTRARPGLSAAGYGPARLTLLSAASTALSCVLGSLLAILLFAGLRGDLGGAGFRRFHGSAADLLGADRPLPLAGALTLLALAPLIAAGTTALVLRPRAKRPTAARTKPNRSNNSGADAQQPAPTHSAALPWGVALIGAGLALEAYSIRDAPSTHAALLPLPGKLHDSPPGVVCGWALTALGLVLAGPGLTYLCGRLLSMGRPGATRLLAGRVLQEEAGRIGRPLGVLCAVASGGYAAAELYGTVLDRSALSPGGPAGIGDSPFGPLTGLAAALIMACATAAALTAAQEVKSARTPINGALVRLGAPAVVLRRAAALRAAVLLLVLAPLTWGVAQLAALPLTH